MFNTNENKKSNKKVIRSGEARKEMNNALYLNNIALKYRYEQMKISEMTLKNKPKNSIERRNKLGFHLGPNFDYDLVKGQKILQEIKQKRLIDKEYQYDIKPVDVQNQKSQIEEIKIASALFNQYMDKMSRNKTIDTIHDQFPSFEYDYFDTFLKQVNTVFLRKGNTKNESLATTDFHSNKTSQGFSNRSSRNNIIQPIPSFGRILTNKKQYDSKRTQTLKKINKMMFDLKSHKTTNQIKFNQGITQDKQYKDLSALRTTNDYNTSKTLKNENKMHLLNPKLVLETNHTIREETKSPLMKLKRSLSCWNVNSNQKTPPKSRNNYPPYNSGKIVRELSQERTNLINDFKKLLQIKAKNLRILRNYKNISQGQSKEEMKITLSKVLFLQNSLGNFINSCGERFGHNIEAILNK